MCILSLQEFDKGTNATLCRNRVQKTRTGKDPLRIPEENGLSMELKYIVCRLENSFRATQLLLTHPH